MSEDLSQDELDKLLSGEVDNVPAPAPRLSDEELQQLASLFDAGWTKLAGNMGQSLGQEVRIEPTGASNTTRGDVSTDLQSLGVLIHVPVTAGASSLHGILLQADATAKLGALIAGDDPAAATLGANELQGVLDFMDMSLPIVADILQEAIGQRAEFGGAQGVNVGDPAEDSDLEALGLAENVVRLDYTLTVGDVLSGPLVYVLSHAHAAEILALIASAAQPAFAEFEAAGGPDAPPAGAEAAGEVPGVENIDLIMDIELEVVARLGEVEMPIREILKLGPGSIIDIDRPADAPVDLVVNDKLVARGDVVVVQENFGLKITEVQSPQERIASLR